MQMHVIGQGDDSLSGNALMTVRQVRMDATFVETQQCADDISCPVSTKCTVYGVFNRASLWRKFGHPNILCIGVS